MPTDAIRGYERQETTHLAVATAVAQGSADCGLGMQAAAQALDLDFVPLFDERFDLAVPVELYESALLAPLFALLRRPQVPVSGSGWRRWVAMAPRSWARCWPKSEARCAIGGFA